MYAAKPSKESSTARRASPAAARGNPETAAPNPVWSRLALAGGAARQSAAAAGGSLPAGSQVQRKPIKDSPLAAKLTSFSMKTGKSPDLVRQPGPKNTVALTITSAVTAEATAQFASAADAAGLQFGFFQLGRPYELYRATMRKENADPAAQGQDIDVNHSLRLQSKLPLPDHDPGQRFFRPITGPASAQVDASGKVSLKYSDFPSTPFDKRLLKGNDTYVLSGLAAQTFFFTAFGAWDGKEAIILGTFYWDMKHCESVHPNDVDATRRGGMVNIAPVRSCKTAGCDLGEPGADQFGQPATLSFGDWVRATVLPMGREAVYIGPGDFSIGCQGPKDKAKPGKND